MTKYLLIYLAVIAAISIVAFFAYMADKRKAKKGKWRTQESVLLGLGFFGGAVGALLGMVCFRHKTKHWYFWAVNILGLGVQIIGGCVLAYFYL